MKRLIPLILVSLFCLWTTIEADQIYEWIDKNGVRHFTNEPPPPGAKIVGEQTEIQHDEAADQKRTQEDQEALEQDLNQQKSRTGQQQESQQETPAVQSDNSDYDSDSDDTAEGVIVNPYLRNRAQVRHYERRRQEREEVVSLS